MIYRPCHFAGPTLARALQRAEPELAGQQEGFLLLLITSHCMCMPYPAAAGRLPVPSVRSISLLSLFQTERRLPRRASQRLDETAEYEVPHGHGRALSVAVPGQKPRQPPIHQTSFSSSTSQDVVKRPVRLGRQRRLLARAGCGSDRASSSTLVTSENVTCQAVWCRAGLWSPPSSAGRTRQWPCPWASPTCPHSR